LQLKRKLGNDYVNFKNCTKIFKHCFNSHGYQTHWQEYTVSFISLSVLCKVWVSFMYRIIHSMRSECGLAARWENSPLLYNIIVCRSFVVSFEKGAVIFNDNTSWRTVTCSDVLEFCFRMTGFKSQHAVFKVKVQLSLCTSCKHREEWRHISTHSSPQH